MRLSALGMMLFVCACADPAPRDRSLAAKLHPAPTPTAPPAPRANAKERPPSTSVVGLVPDPLAQLYAEGAPLVVRFDDMTSLLREARPQLEAICRALPALRLPAGSPANLLRRVLRLPDSVAFDALRPFAFVQVDGGWAGVVPTRSRKEGGARLRALDGIYCVAGDPAIVAAYEPGFRRGFYLPGDVSVIAAAGALPTLGTSLAACFRRLRLPLGGLDEVLCPVPTDIDRIDIAARFGQGGLRIDLRLAPDRESPTAIYLERMKPASSSAARWLPSDGTIYAEMVSPPLDWEGLVLNLLRDSVPPPGSKRAEGLLALRGALAALGRDAAAMVDLDPDGSGMVFLVADLVKRKPTLDYLRSEAFGDLLERIAGPGGKLEWMPDVFERGGVRVGAVTGHISRACLQQWRSSGGLFESTLSVLLRGPVVSYVAVAGDKLCIIIGHRARAETERFLDHLKSGRAVDNDHNVEVAALFPQRLAAVSADLAAIFDGTREAARYWHPKGRALKSMALRWRLPAAIAVTVEGGALRVAVRVRPRMIADAAAKISEALSK